MKKISLKCRSLLLFFFLTSNVHAELQPEPIPSVTPAAEANSKAEVNTSPAAPFAFADFSWAPANYGPPESAISTKYFTGEFRIDSAVHYEFSNPKDNSISGSSEAFRHRELQLTQIGMGGDFNYNNVNIRLMTQFGMYSQTTPRNDASPARGQWQLNNAYRYISEAYGGYHIDSMNGINIQAGIFMSYIGLWSYYNFDNWTYQPSYVSSNTPWYFNGVRVQIFPSDKLKIEPWIINGWEAYGMFAHTPGVGVQILWRPVDWFSINGNQYYGSDDLGFPDRRRFHTDDSVMFKYYDNENPNVAISRAAFSLTVDAGCDWGPSGADSSGLSTTTVGANCGNNSFKGFMAYNRLWFNRNRFGLTLGGGAITNTGRYLVLLPPINGATAASGSPYFTENPGDPFWAWDSQLTFDYMPNRNYTFRIEFNHRWASVPYFAGPDGLTPLGGNNGNPSAPVAGWSPDLVQSENRMTVAFMLRL